MTHHPNPATPSDTEVINECVSAIAHGIALGALDFDYPVFHHSTGDVPFPGECAHDLLRAAQRDEEILEELTQDYTPLAKEFVALIPTATVLDPAGHVQVSPENEDWIGVGVELYIHHDLSLFSSADLAITPKRCDGIYGSRIEDIDDPEDVDGLVLVLFTPQRTHRIRCAKNPT